MLEIRDLVVRYGEGKDALTAVDGVSLGLDRASTLGLVGESGSGKSTIARAIVGLVPVSGGSILFEGRDVTESRSRSTPQFRRRVQMVFQDPAASLNPRMSVGSILREAAARRTTPAPGRNERARIATESMELVGLSSSALDRYPHQFSGGQKQRIAIARALCVGPEVLILDEVTSALDVSVQASILQLLNEIQASLGISMLFISHDLAVVGLMSANTAVMFLGRIVETAETDILFRQPRHPYTAALLASVPQFGEPRRRIPIKGDIADPRRPPSGCRFRLRCGVGPLQNPARVVCEASDPQMIASRMPNRAACHYARGDEAAVGA